VGGTKFLGCLVDAWRRVGREKERGVAERRARVRRGMRREVRDAIASALRQESCECKGQERIV
jgi:hypothetical protein